MCESDPRSADAELDVAVTGETGDAFAIPEVPVADLGKDALGELRNPCPGTQEAVGIAVWVEPQTMTPAGRGSRRGR